MWVRLDDRFPENPKVAPLSDAAFRAYVWCLCYAGRNETDGVVPRAVIPSQFHDDILNEIFSSSLAISDGKSLRIRDFLEYNPSRKSLRAKRKAAAKRMRRVRANFARTSREVRLTPTRPVPLVGNTPPDPPASGGEVVLRRPNRRGVLRRREQARDVSPATARLFAEHGQRLGLSAPEVDHLAYWSPASLDAAEGAIVRAQSRGDLVAAGLLPPKPF